MRSITCPRCGSPVELRRFFNPASKPFCARCGWNVDRVEKDLAANSSWVIFVPLAILAVGGLFFLTASRTHSADFFVFPALVALIGLAPVWSYFSTKNALAAARLTMNPGLAQSLLPVDPSLQMLQSLPRPRRVRFGLKGNVAVIVIVFMAIGAMNVIGFLALSRRPQGHSGTDLTPLIPLLFVLAVFAILVVIPIVRERRNVPLLRDGEMAQARVVRQETVRQGKSNYSRIDYEFTAGSGQLIRNSVRDLTNAVFEEMTIPVFYDPLDPAKNVALCASYMKIVDSFR